MNRISCRLLLHGKGVLGVVIEKAVTALPKSMYPSCNVVVHNDRAGEPIVGCTKIAAV